MRKLLLLSIVAIIFAGCGGPSLPAMKDYTLNETSFKVYEGWKEEVKEEGKLKMILYTPGSLWGSFSLMRYEGLDGKTVFENLKKSFPSMGNKILAQYSMEINDFKFDFLDFQNADRNIPMKYGMIGVASGTGYALAVQIYSEFQGLDHEQNVELKALVQTIKMK
jgi:hypothetical protein